MRCDGRCPLARRPNLGRPARPRAARVRGLQPPWVGVEYPADRRWVSRGKRDPFTASRLTLADPRPGSGPGCPSVIVVVQVDILRAPLLVTRLGPDSIAVSRGLRRNGEPENRRNGDRGARRGGEMATWHANRPLTIDHCRSSMVATKAAAGRPENSAGSVGRRGG